MRRYLIILILIVTTPCPLFAAESPWPRNGIISRITGNEVVVILNDASGLQAGDKIAITTEQRGVKSREKSATAPLTLLAPTFPGKVVGLVVADLDADGKTEIVIALEEKIILGRLHGQEWTTLIEKPIGGALNALDLDSFDLDGDHRPELLLTATRGAVLASMIFAFDGKNLQVKAPNTPWFLRALDLPGAGQTLLGQRHGNDLYESDPFQLSWKEGEVLAGQDKLFPAGVTLHGCQAFPSASGDLWLCLDQSDNLTVRDLNGEQLWQGNEKFGGKESYLEWAPRGARGEVQRSYLRSSPKRSGSLIILPQNDGPRSMSNWRKAEKSRLTALRWNGYEMEKVWESPTRDGYLADFAYGDVDNDGQSEYLLAGTLATGFFSKSTTALFLWKGPKAK